MSDVIKLLDITWKNANQGTSHSYGRLNHAMREALTLAIGGGFAFDLKDFAHIMAHYRSGYWIGESDEWCYALAVTVGNLSAATSFEAYKERGPFIADDVNTNGHTAYLHNVGDRRRERLAVGFSFPWIGEKVTVTSFAKDGLSLTACAYADGQNKQCSKCFHTIVTKKCQECQGPLYDGYYEDRKLRKRFKITWQAILDYRAEVKEAMIAESVRQAELREESRKREEAMRPVKEVLSGMQNIKG